MLANHAYINFVVDVGRLAQLVRATGLHPVGWGFESLTAHHIALHISAQSIWHWRRMFLAKYRCANIGTNVQLLLMAL